MASALLVPIYIHVDIAVPDPVNSYVLPLGNPITIDRHACYTAKLHQFFVLIDTDVKERKYPCYLIIDDMWRSNHAERHVVQRLKVRRSDLKTPDAACLLPNCDLAMHSNIALLPPAPGIYNHLEFSIRALNAKQLSFSRLIAIIEIQQCREASKAGAV
jgi:hypothetical protein